MPSLRTGTSWIWLRWILHGKQLCRLRVLLEKLKGYYYDIKKLKGKVNSKWWYIISFHLKWNIFVFLSVKIILQNCLLQSLNLTCCWRFSSWSWQYHLVPFDVTRLKSIWRTLMQKHIQTILWTLFKYLGHQGKARLNDTERWHFG